VLQSHVDVLVIEVVATSSVKREDFLLYAVVGKEKRSINGKLGSGHISHSRKQSRYVYEACDRGHDIWWLWDVTILENAFVFHGRREVDHLTRFSFNQLVYMRLSSLSSPHIPMTDTSLVDPTIREDVKDQPLKQHYREGKQLPE
jgi:hypothetical protein